jgi:cytochrome b6-f complex iron-sulfur subunit
MPVKVGRRDFLGIITRILLWFSGFVSMGGLIRFLAYRPDPVSTGRYILEPPSAYPIGSSILHSIEGFILYRDNRGLFARSLVCPHLGCVVQQENREYKCPCHGSGFGETGELLNGPATESLRPVWLEIDHEGRLVVDIHVKVAWDWHLEL